MNARIFVQQLPNGRGLHFDAVIVALDGVATLVDWHVRAMDRPDQSAGM